MHFCWVRWRRRFLPIMYGYRISISPWNRWRQRFSQHIQVVPIAIPQHIEDFFFFRNPLSQHGYRVIGYVHWHLIDASLTLLLYKCRSRDGEGGNSKDKKDPRDFVVPTHYCEMCKVD